MKKLVNTVIALSLNVVFFSAFASGGGAGGYSQNSAPASRKVDQTYEIGKAIYSGRKGYNKTRYCVDYKGQRVPLKGKSIRQFKKVSLADFEKSLFNCDKPEELALSTLSKDEQLYVLYYLNKRYKLYLK